MKTILIVLGLTATQLQQKSSLNLDVASLYDYDARYFQGPIAVQYEIGNLIINLPESEVVSVSFTMGILTSANITPHRRPLNGAETASLCQELNELFLNRGFSAPNDKAKSFKAFYEGLKLGHDPLNTPPWRFGWDKGDETVNIVTEPFESSSPSANASVKRYTISLGFGNSKVSEMANSKMNAIRKQYFPNIEERIPMSQYPKQ